MDQLIIDGKASYDDFGASVAQRTISMPKKKVIKETVPFTNITYDFSAIGGEVYWEERDLEYVLELTADTPEELEEAKTKVSAWLAGTQGAKLHDPYVFGYHFLATYEDMKISDDEGLDKTTLTVTFKAYPYKIADITRTYGWFQLRQDGEAREVVLLYNQSDHPVTLYVENKYNDPVQIVSLGLMSEVIEKAGTFALNTKLPTGWTEVILGIGAVDYYGADVRLSFTEEVF